MSSELPAPIEGTATPSDPPRLTASRAAWDWQRSQVTGPSRERRKMAIRSAVGLLAAVVFWLLHAHRASALAGFAGVLSALLAAIAPARILRSLDHYIDLFSRGVGRVVSVVVLTPIYFAFIVPLGFFLRRRPEALYQRQMNRAAATYWTRPTGSQSPEHPY